MLSDILNKFCKFLQVCATFVSFASFHKFSQVFSYFFTQLKAIALFNSLLLLAIWDWCPCNTSIHTGDFFSRSFVVGKDGVERDFGRFVDAAADFRFVVFVDVDLDFLPSEKDDFVQI